MVELCVPLTVILVNYFFTEEPVPRIGKVLFLHELGQSSFIVHNSKFLTKFKYPKMNEFIVLFFFQCIAASYYFFKIIATVHLEPQTAIILQF